MDTLAQTRAPARQGMAMIYGAVQRQAALLSFVEVFHLMGILFLACTLLVLLMRTAKAPRIAHVEKHRIQLQPRLRADTATTPGRL